MEYQHFSACVPTTQGATVWSVRTKDLLKIREQSQKSGSSIVQALIDEHSRDHQEHQPRGRT
jgi:hypothetical protein